MFSYRALKSIANCIICIGGRKEAGSVFFSPCFESLPFSLGKEREKKLRTVPKERKKLVEFCFSCGLNGGKRRVLPGCNEWSSCFSFLFLMGQTRSPEGPRVLAHKLKPLASPDSGPQETTVFNAAVIHSLSIIKLQNINKTFPAIKWQQYYVLEQKTTFLKSIVCRELKSQLSLLFVPLRLWFRGFNRFSGLLLKHKPTICVALCQDRWQTFS